MTVQVVVNAPVTRRSALYADLFGAAAIFVAASFALLAFTAQHFPTAEFNDWLNWAHPVDVADLLRRMTLREHWFSRDLSMALVHQSSISCGVNLLCLNAWSIAPLAIAAPMVFLLSRALSLPMGLAALATLVWFVSWPTMDALAWHATAHDRWALVFVLVALLLGMHAFRGRSGRPLAVNAAISLVAALVVWLASNCKEASWFAAPALFCLAWATSDRTRIRRFLDTWISWPSLIYAAWHAFSFQVAVKSSGAQWLNHVGGGDITGNLALFSATLLGISARYVALLLVIAAMVVAIRAKLRRRLTAIDPDPSGRVMGALWLGLLMAVSIPARGSAPAPYYMLIPHALFVPLVLAWVSRHAFPAKMAGKTWLPMSLALGLLGAFVVGKLGVYLEFLEQSRNFSIAVRQLVRLSPPALESPPVVLHHPAAVRATLLLRAEEWGAIWRFGDYPQEAAPVWLKQPVRWSYSWGMLQRAANDRQTYLYLDESLRLTEISVPPR